MLSKLRWQMLVMLTALFVLALLTTSAANATETTKTESFKVKKGGVLEVEIDDAAADILVKTWEKAEVLVKVVGIPLEDLDELKISESANTVRVEYYGYGGWRRSRHARITATVPTEFNLDLSTSGGDIEVTDKIKGKVDAATSGGDVEVGVVEGDIQLRTSGGDVTASDVLGEATLRTSGGDIEVGNVKGVLTASTSGGDISVGSVEKSLKASTAGGDIMIDNVGGDAVVSTAGGDIEVGKVSGSASVKTAGGDIELMGASGEVEAKTAGGDIECHGITGSIDAATAGGDIVAELMPEGRQGSSLETKGGDIELYIPGDAKVTIEARIRIRGRWYDEDEYEITSDFEAELHEKDKKSVRAKYVINGGGPRVTLETVNGNIYIQRMGKSR
ncbi:MAG: DUF4097 family beta strand repeat protein [Candidatus Latescibacterota bacterium]|nr:MAG: DUF4097 family beta strand repeat protein [Candidatus Latescibacterota bacterium]